MKTKFSSNNKFKEPLFMRSPKKKESIPPIPREPEIAPEPIIPEPEILPELPEEPDPEEDPNEDPDEGPTPEIEPNIPPEDCMDFK
jgi:hypothetical protein